MKPKPKSKSKSARVTPLRSGTKLHFEGREGPGYVRYLMRTTAGKWKVVDGRDRRVTQWGPMPAAEMRSLLRKGAYTLRPRPVQS